MTTSASPSPALPDERLAVGAARLAARHAGRLSVETVQRVLIDSYPGRRYLDWPVPDLDGAPVEIVRAIRDEIDAHITELLGSLPTAA